MKKSDDIKSKDKKMSFRINENSLILLNQIADKKKISFSEVVRLAIESYLKK